MRARRSDREQRDREGDREIKKREEEKREQREFCKGKPWKGNIIIPAVKSQEYKKQII